jgi:hypothetical protein
MKNPPGTLSSRMKQTIRQFLRKVLTLLIRSEQAIIGPPVEYIVSDTGKAVVEWQFLLQSLACFIPPP